MSRLANFCYIGPDVELQQDVELISNVHIEGNTKKLVKGQKYFHLQA